MASGSEIEIRLLEAKEDSVKALFWTMAAAVVMAIVITGMSVSAHHASGPFYDSEKRVEAVGTVTSFVFRNPHSFLYVDAPVDGGETIKWEIEMGASVMMSRRGWTPETIKAGDEIKVVGQPSRAPGTFGMCCAELTKTDGSPIRP
ncbi:MAG: hypothetical protein CL484_15310 [Acidobacteria bacterium]|nr:hypothetical protein [Acidobacteriota bacterium]